MTLGQLWWQLLLLAIGSYLLGNVNSAILISKCKKTDIRKQGSGNPGTLNMSRVFGMKIGVLVLVLDVLKGVIPTLCGRLIFDGLLFENSGMPVWVLTEYLAGFFVVLGHIFPAFYSFKGGKGIASTIGVFFVGEWYITLLFCVFAVLFIFATSLGSVGSFIATTPPAIAACLRLSVYYFPTLTFQYAGFYIVTNAAILGIVFLTWFAHRKNIARLLAGEEHDTNWLQMLKKMSSKSKQKAKQQSNLNENQNVSISANHNVANEQSKSYAENNVVINSNTKNENEDSATEINNDKF